MTNHVDGLPIIRSNSLVSINEESELTTHGFGFLTAN